MALEIEPRSTTDKRGNSVVIIDISEQLSVGWGAKKLESIFEQLSENDGVPSRLLLNFREATFFDDVFLSVVKLIVNKIEKAGGEIKFLIDRESRFASYVRNMQTFTKYATFDPEDVVIDSFK